MIVAELKHPLRQALCQQIILKGLFQGQGIGALDVRVMGHGVLPLWLKASAYGEWTIA
ncbi:hypothetical protein D3C79_488710 [compost metagenome]